VPADVRERYERLKQNDLPAVVPRDDVNNSDADDDDDDDDDDDEDAGPEPSSQQVSLGSLLPMTLL
jgi:hypothetical protein